MTKIKNTKKGMAKKTLSMSLVVAMLATSNVPVWAAEFSDGTDAAAVASEADTFSTDAEAPVVEDNAADATDAQAIGDAWTVKLDKMPTEVEWGATKDVTVEVKDVDGKVVTGKSELKYVWKNVATGLAVTDAATISGTITTPATTSANVGTQYVLYIYDESGDWTYTSSAFTVGAKDISKAYTISYKDKDGKVVDKNRTYTGKETDKNAVIGDENVKFEIDYTGDLVNVGTVNVTAKPVDSKLYKGVIPDSFEIRAAALTDNTALVKTTLNTKEVEYTGEEITLKKSDVNVTDANTGANLNDLVNKDAVIKTGLTNVDADATKNSVTVNVPLTSAKSVKNFSGTGSATTTDKVKIVARDLSKVTVTVDPMVKKVEAGKGVAYPQNELTFHFKDANGKELNLGKDITVEGLDKALNYGTYTLTIKPRKNADGTANRNVTGQTTAQFSIFSQDISKATFSDAIKAQEYTGSQIKPDVSKLKVKLGGEELDPSDYTIEYGENVKAGKGHIYIVGKRTYEGSKADIDFDITPVTVTKKDDIKAADYVIINENAKEAKEYAQAIGLVVKAKNGAFTLTEGTDYTVSYAYDNTTDNNKVGNNIIATITLKENGNFKSTEKLTATVRIANPIISDSDIKMNQTSYEYTGAVIVPDFSVVVGGKTLKKDTDYVIDSVVDSAKVGTATVYITGKAGSKYDSKIKAKATFTVTPVSAEKTVVSVTAKKDIVYDGTAKKADYVNVKVTLNGNDVTNQFDVAYGENINAGDKAGTVTVTPKKDNKNFTTGTSQTGTFKIAQKELTGVLKVYDARGIAYTIENDTIKKNGKEVSFDYDGTEKTFAKVVFVPDDKNVTANDYEIKYFNNITGTGKAYVAVIAKGNYSGTDTLNDWATGKAVEVKNVSKKLEIKINSKQYFTEKEVAVKDAEYAGSRMLAKPSITVNDGSKVLVEGTDYTVKLYKDKNHTEEIKDGVNEIGTYYWVVQGKEDSVYGDVLKPAKDNNGNVTKIGKNYAEGEWKVTKKNVANLDVKVDLNEKGETVLTVMNGNLKVDNKEFTVTLSEDKKTATVAATTGNKYYVGSKEVTVGGEVAKVGTPVISGVKVVGNKATVILSGEADGASGYDYVISKANNTTTDRVDITKNQVKTIGDFSYVQQGTYYAYCHAWKRNAEGKKVFSGWSNIYPFSVSAITPSQPVITSVKASGSTVTVTYTKADNADGYDVVLGTATKKVNGETRPVEYGTLVKKNIKGNVVTATFKNVKKGTYYAGLHAFNKTSEDGTKVFSQWSNAKKVTVK